MRWTLLALLLPLAACSLPKHPTSPTERYSQVSVTVSSNAGNDSNTDWPLLVIRSQLTGEQALLRRQKSAVLHSTHYSGRVSPGRYQLLGLLNNPSSASRKAKLSGSLGSFDAIAEKHCNLGTVLHWRIKNSATISRSLRTPNSTLCWNRDSQDKMRARQFAERKQNISPPASLSNGPIIRHSGLLSYRPNRNVSWKTIDSGSTAITAAVELTEGELVIGGEHGQLSYYRNGEKQHLALSPEQSVVLALENTPTGLAMLISTAESLQLLFTADIQNQPWKIVEKSEFGFNKMPAKNIQLSLKNNQATATSLSGKVLLSAQLQ